MALRLGFHYHVPALQDEQGYIKAPSSIGCFLDSVAAYCERVVCFMHSPQPTELARMDYIIQSSNIELVNIGPHSSTLKRTLNAHRFTAPLRNYSEKLDALLIRGPSPLLPAMANAVDSLPVALLIVGDYLAGIDDLPQPRWRKEAIRAWSWWNYRQQMTLARKSLTLVNSHKLYEEYASQVPHLYETRTTTLSEQDFFVRQDTCIAPPYHLLYTGRMARAKGLLHLGKAVEILTKQGEDVVLDLVGWQEKSETALDELLAFAKNKGLEDRIIFHGSRPVGPELFSFYKNGDIYIIASTHEGFPRTIWEAMAHSLPIVATSVGSIPDYLENRQDALIVEPRNTIELVTAVNEIIHNTTLRQTLMQNGYNTASGNTLEVRAKELIQRMEQWIETA